jgi:uncharacterized protein YprB with RNaseH-like and TPR domain
MNLHSKTRKELLWLANNSCKEHGHSYLEHPNCYDKDFPSKQRIGFLDIESTGFKSDYDHAICYCIKDGDKIIGDKLVKSDFKNGYHVDKRLMKSLIRDLKKFDKIVSFYGKGFDVPFLRGRTVINGLDFPPFGSMFHEDLYYSVRGKYGLSRNSLENSCKFLVGKSNKTHIDAVHWVQARQGNEKSIKYIFDHNKFDVIDTQNLYDKLYPYSKHNETSI